MTVNMTYVTSKVNYIYMYVYIQIYLILYIYIYADETEITCNYRR